MRMLATEDRARSSDMSVPILMYHSISTQSTAEFRKFAVSPARFETQMSWLAERGYRTLTMAEFTEMHGRGRGMPAKTVIITFDDGFADFHDTAFPIMHEYGIRSTLFVTTSYVGGTACWLRGCGEGYRRMLSWSALEELAVEGVEIGAHSHTHPELDRLGNREQYEELIRSKGMLEEALSRKVVGLAYPFGYWKGATRRHAVAAHYLYACGVDDVMAREKDDLWTLPRLTVTPDLDVDQFASLLTKRSGEMDRRVVAAKRWLWRALRQTSVVGQQPRKEVS